MNVKNQGKASVTHKAIKESEKECMNEVTSKGKKVYGQLKILNVEVSDIFRVTGTFQARMCNIT